MGFALGFELVLITGRTAEEADYLVKVATILKEVRIDSMGRLFKSRADLRALAARFRKIRRTKLGLIHDRAAKAEVVSRIASIRARA